MLSVSTGCQRQKSFFFSPFPSPLRGDFGPVSRIGRWFTVTRRAGALFCLGIEGYFLGSRQSQQAKRRIQLRFRCFAGTGLKLLLEPCQARRGCRHERSMGWLLNPRSDFLPKAPAAPVACRIGGKVCAPNGGFARKFRCASCRGNDETHWNVLLTLDLPFELKKNVVCVNVRRDPSCFGPIKSAAPTLCCRSGRASQTGGCASKAQVKRK